jgi:hypothetical protein
MRQLTRQHLHIVVLGSSVALQLEFFFGQLTFIMISGELNKEKKRRRKERKKNKVKYK